MADVHSIKGIRSSTEEHQYTFTFLFLLYILDTTGLFNTFINTLYRT